jgi:RNA polymerase sigma-70 factor (family 1)
MPMKNDPGHIVNKERNEVSSKAPCFDYKRIKGNNADIFENLIIVQLKQGEHSAFSLIFSAYYRDLVLYANSFVHNVNDAEEIVQDTFTQIWDGRTKLNIDRSLKSFLVRAVHNGCIDWCRHKKIIDRHHQFVLQRSRVPECNTDDYVLYSELRDHIENALKIMPESISRVFVLSRQKGLKYKEIASMLNISVRTVEDRIAKALQSLKSQLREFF